MGSPSVSAAVRTACDDQVVLAVWRSALVGIPASLLLALILGSSVPTSARVEFVVLVSVADVACFSILSSYRRRRRRGETVERFWMGPCCAALIGLAWGSLALIGLPDAQHVELRTIYLLFVAGTSATYVVGAAARRIYYWASQLPMVIPPAIVFLRSDDQVTRLLGVAIIIYFGVMTLLHRDVHSLVLSELTLRQQNETAGERLAYQAQHDSLTGLANRATFIDRLDDAFATTHSHALVGILYIDIDRFKVVNDSLGHAAGDELLVSIASRMRGVVDEPALLARFGGDEFTVLITDLESESVAVQTANRVAAVLEAPFELGGRSVRVSASIGVATTRKPAGDASSLLAQADAAQYRAKQTGHNRVEIFNMQLRESLERRLDEEQRVRRAIENGEIAAWYQPIVDLRTGRIVGAEALARWAHPTRGMLDAFKFVPLIEDSDLIVPLDDCIIQQAVEGATRLAANARGVDFRIWCNASAHHFSRINPAERFARLLERTGCDGNLIGLEITETVLLEDPRIASREIAVLRDLGVKTALDDFGIGHSSFALLRSLPIDAVKIDRSFVRDISRDLTAAGVVQSICSLANAVGIDSVAEGVETAEQAHLLRDFGCHYAQGYLWGKAMPGEQLAAQLRAASIAPILLARPVQTEPNPSMVGNND
jgi:diguanylate cyclase (GGDEF)-like protein